MFLAYYLHCFHEHVRVLSLLPCCIPQMGLGKTLESLMLILSNPPPPGWAVGGADYEVPKDGDAVPIKATVIIVPRTLLDQWQDEVQRHVKPVTLRW